jgi:hypothetical protein
MALQDLISQLWSRSEWTASSRRQKRLSPVVEHVPPVVVSCDGDDVLEVHVPQVSLGFDRHEDATEDVKEMESVVELLWDRDDVAIGQ